MMKTWTIVIFTEEDTVEAVPTNWITDGKCYWPPLTSEKLTAAIKNHIIPNSSWPLFPIRLIRNGTFDNYIVAKEKCRKADYSSDINSDRSVGSKRTVMRKTYGSSFEENDVSSSDDNNNLTSKLPTPPRLTNENYFKEIIRQQNMLKASMWQYTDSLNELTTSINRLFTNDGKVTHQEEKAPSFFTMFDFPVNNEENLIRIDEYLHDEKNFNVAMKEVSKIGGCSVYNFIQRALQMIITNNLAATYSWLGRRSKKAFNKLKLSDLIIGSVKRNFPNCTNKECEEAIQKWLKRAKERSVNNKKHEENNVDTA